MKRHRENAMWRLEWYCHKPRNVCGYQKLEEASKAPSPTSFNEKMALPHLLTSRTEAINICLSELPSLSYFLTAALGNSYRWYNHPLQKKKEVKVIHKGCLEILKSLLMHCCKASYKELRICFCLHVQAKPLPLLYIRTPSPSTFILPSFFIFK